MAETTAPHPNPSPPEAAPSIGYRPQWRLVVLVGLAIAALHVGIFWLFYLTGWAELNPLRAGLGSKILAWVPTLVLYGWLVWQVRNRSVQFRPFTGLVTVLSCAFVWIFLDAGNGVLIEYVVDPNYDLRMYEYSLRSIETDVENGVVNPDRAKSFIEQRKLMIEAAKKGPTPVSDLLLSSLKINLLLSSIYGLILGVLFRPVRR